MIIVSLALLATISIGQAATNDVRIVHAEIATMLRSTNGLAWKRERITAYVKIGDSRKDVERKLGQAPDQDGHGLGFQTLGYFDSGLHITFYPDGTCAQIEYVDIETEKYVLLAGERELTWPRTGKKTGPANNTSEGIVADRAKPSK